MNALFALYLSLLQTYKHVQHQQYVESLRSKNPMTYEMVVNHEYSDAIHRIWLWIHELFSNEQTCYFCEKPYSNEEKMEILTRIFGNIFSVIFSKVLP